MSRNNRNRNRNNFSNLPTLGSSNQDMASAMINLLSMGNANVNADANQHQIKTFTNKEYLIDLQEKCIFQRSLADTFQGFQSMHTATTNLPSVVAKVNLLPENRVNIKTLLKNIGTPMKGKFFLCRVITLPYKANAVATIVDDPEGKLATRLTMYNYTNASTPEALEQVLPVGMILAIKNPWMKTTADGGLAVRSDNPTDIVVVEAEIEPILLGKIRGWAGEIPPQYSSRMKKTCSNGNAESVDSILKLKNLGNQNFVDKKYSDAIRFYNQALKISPENVDILSNRAAAYLKLGCYNMALQDTSTLLEINQYHVKGIYRHIKSLWGLNCYKEAIVIINTKLTEEPTLSKVKELSDMKLMAEKLYLQHTTGDFDVLQFLDKKNDMSSVEAAEYTGPVTVKPVSGKGRGLVATSQISAGELILCCKPFAIYFCKENPNVLKYSVNYDYKSINLHGHDEIVEVIAQKLALEPDLGRKFYKLHAGPQMGNLSEKSEAIEEVDIKRIERIVTFNSFANKGGKFTICEKKTIGIWLVPSYINHSCSDGNCSWNIVGDLMIIRAVKPIAKGEEILIGYIEPSSSFEMRQAIFENHSFICRCSLCQLEMTESKNIHKQRQDILKELQEFQESDSPLNIDVVMKKIFELGSLQKTNPKLNMSLTHPVVTDLASKLLLKTEDQRCLEVLEKVHVLSKESPLAPNAVVVCLYILGWYLKNSDKRMVDKWVKVLKKNLIVAYGSVEPMCSLGEEILPALDAIGWKSFF